MANILAVFGATGNQGGSVIRAVLADPVLSKSFKIRAITRDATTPSSQDLVKQGVEVITVSCTSDCEYLSLLKYLLLK